MTTCRVLMGPVLLLAILFGCAPVMPPVSPLVEPAQVESDSYTAVLFRWKPGIKLVSNVEVLAEVWSQAYPRSPWGSLAWDTDPGALETPRRASRGKRSIVLTETAVDRSALGVTRVESLTDGRKVLESFYDDTGHVTNVVETDRQPCGINPLMGRRTDILLVENLTGKQLTHSEPLRLEIPFSEFVGDQFKPLGPALDIRVAYTFTGDKRLDGFTVAEVLVVYEVSTTSGFIPGSGCPDLVGRVGAHGEGRLYFDRETGLPVASYK